MLLACFSVVPSLILPQSRTLRTPPAAHRAALRCVGPDDSVDRVLDRKPRRILEHGCGNGMLFMLRITLRARVSSL